MKKLIILLFVCGFGFAHAQQNYFYLNWNYNIPLTNQDWIENASSRGGKIGYRAFIGEGKFSAGLDLHWTYYDQYKPTETFTSPGRAITTDYFNYLFSYGAAVSGQYYFPVGKNERLFPYAGLGLGATYNEYIVQYNIYEDNTNGWGFLARPEAGILFRFGERRSLGAMAAIHYDYTTNKSEDFDLSNFSTVGFQLGIILMSW